MNRVLFSSASDNWSTPDDLFSVLNLEFSFTLDVAADPFNAKCDRFFTVSDDGLKQEWSGVVWCNPPYNRRVGSWLKKASEASCTVVMLLPSRTDTKWFHDYALNCTEIRFLRGRLRFGGSKDPAPFPSMLCIWRR